MAVVENASSRNSSSDQNLDKPLVSKLGSDSVVDGQDTKVHGFSNDKTVNGHENGCEEKVGVGSLGNGAKSEDGVTGIQNQLPEEKVHCRVESNGKSGMSDLVEMLSKLNPMAKEFVPPSHLVINNGYSGNGFGYMNDFGVHDDIYGNGNGHMFKKKKNYNQGRRRMTDRTNKAQREEIIRRTVYVSDIDQSVTEEQLAGLFVHCGQVVDCRICGDPNSVLRFAFVEFTDQEGARASLILSGTMLGYYPLRVLPSKTAIAPVNPTFLPRSEDEREMCARTVYVTNIDRKVTQMDIKLFFQAFCGEVHRLRVLGDYHHSTCIAFVEFAMAESAIAALNCSGAVLGSFPIRVSPSKTPVRPHIPRSPLH